MAAPTCAICNGSASKRCASCVSISYCSPECQKTDWSLHKMICKKLTALTPRPSPAHKLGILFPVNSKDLQPVWIYCKPVDGGPEADTGFEVADARPLLDPEHLDSRSGVATRCGFLTRNKLRGFQIIHRYGFLVDGSSLNACIRHTAKGRMTRDWRGPTVAMRLLTADDDPRGYKDMTGADVRTAVDLFLMD